MRQIKNHLLVVLGFGLAGAIGASFGTGTAQAIVASLVQIANTTSNPVPTHHVAADNPATQAVELQTGCTLLAGVTSGDVPMFDSTTGNNYVVPAGKRLVVESLSGEVIAATGLVPRTSIYSSNPAVGSLVMGITPNIALTGSASGENYYTFDSPSRGYADPGSEIVLHCQITPASISKPQFSATVAGHLEDIQ